MHETQRLMNDVIITTKDDIIVILSSRRLGKSYMLCIKATETCLKEPNAIVKYVCPRQKQVQTAIRPIMNDILNDCPADLKPEWIESLKIYRFPNGSEIQIAGVDGGQCESLRGSRANLCIVDEAGEVDNLEYVVYSILAPTTDTTGGKIILASTPSKDPMHDFIQSFVKPAEASNKLLKFTINDNPLLSEEKKEAIAMRYPGGKDSPHYKREYLCEISADSELTVIPEFTEEIEKKVVFDIDPPPYYDAYVAGDVGFKDLTVFLFAYYDYLHGRVVILDELVLRGANEVRTDKIAQGIKDKEDKWFKDKLTLEVKEPYLRIMDNVPIMINDLRNIHKLIFMPTQKDNKEAAINKTRIMMANEQIIISPRCKTLNYHLKSACWKPDRKDFRRLPDVQDGSIRGGHADALDSLIYLVRNVITSKNPYPAGYDVIRGEGIHQSRFPKRDNSTVSVIKRIFNINN